MTTADYHEGTGLNTDQTLQFPLSLTGSNTLATRVAYDMNGRILGKLGGGVSPGDSAAYIYYADSYRPASVLGKLTTGSRNTDHYENFQYDAVGRMTWDLSKGLEIAYGADGMPVEMAARHGQETVALHPLYDASGYRVSQLAAARPSRAFPTYWVGRHEGEEPENLYTAASIYDALTDADYQLNFVGLPAPDSVVLYVVPDEWLESKIRSS